MSRALFSATGEWPLSKAGGGRTRVQPHAAQGAVLAPAPRQPLSAPRLSPLPTRSHHAQAWVRGRVKGRCQREKAARSARWGNTGQGAWSGRWPPAGADSGQLGVGRLGGQCHYSQSQSPVTQTSPREAGSPSCIAGTALTDTGLYPAHEPVNIYPITSLHRDSQLSLLLMENRSLPGNRGAGTDCYSPAQHPLSPFWVMT